MTMSRVLAGAAALVALLLLVVLVNRYAWNDAIGEAPAAHSSAQPAEPGQTGLATEPLEIVTSSGTRSFQVEVARSEEQQAKGLMFRTQLADDRGMIFTHDPPRDVSMWMRNTYIPLDMVFIAAGGKVHRIAERTEPLSEKIISSQGRVAAVLELAGGAAERLGIKPGDVVRHSLFDNAPPPAKP